MAKYHHNVYPILVDKFSYCLDLLNDFFLDIDNRFPYHIADALDRKELNFMLRCLPKNATYMVLNSNGFSVWVLPTAFSTKGIETAILGGVIDLDRVSRDLDFYELKTALIDLPYNSHYIVQRYYE